MSDLFGNPEDRFSHVAAQIISSYSIQVQTLSVGDIVKISENIHSVKELQKGHGEWNDSMKAVSYCDGYLNLSYDVAVIQWITSCHK